MRTTTTLVSLLLLGCAPGAHEDDDGPRGEYPTGPYGVTAGDVLRDHTFVDVSGAELSLASIYADGKNELLLLSTAAGWCTACIEEQPALNDLFSEFGDQGLVVMVALFETSDFSPASVSTAVAWQEQYDLDFPVVVDAAFELSAYYDETLTPMNMIVALDTMEILRINTGWDESATRAIIEARL